MTVKDLIAALSQVPPDLLVMTDNGDHPSYLACVGVETIFVREEPDGNPGVFFDAKEADISAQRVLTLVTC